MATSALTFRALILAVAKKAGLAYYGADGTEMAQIPVDPHDLAQCKAIVNSGLRMFLSDAPPAGWRWTRVVDQLVMWPTLAVDATRTVVTSSYDPQANQTLLIASDDQFYPTMEHKDIVVTGQGTFRMTEYVSPTQMYVEGNVSFAAATYSIACDGNYTLPSTFAGTYTGAITYVANTNQAIPIEWGNEAAIRQLREDATTLIDTPVLAAIRGQNRGNDRQRYELLVYPIPGEVLTVEFPYELHFDEFEGLSERSPAPVVHDNTIRTACLAVVERDLDDRIDGPYMTQYRQADLLNSIAIDNRSGPRKLGYFGNPVGERITPANFRQFTTRPNVTYNT